jgi:transposase
MPLVAAGDHPERRRSDSSWAHLCGAPIPACSGTTAGRYRPGRGGDRQATSALWPIVIVTMSPDPAARAYAGRRREDGLTLSKPHARQTPDNREEGLDEK